MSSLHRAVLESLEPRQLLSTLYWQGGSGNWNYTSTDHWNTASDGSGTYVAFSSGDTAVFTSDANATITVTADIAAAAATFSGSGAFTLDATGQTLTINSGGKVQNNGNLNWAGGSITLNHSYLYNLGQMFLTGGDKNLTKIDQPRPTNMIDNTGTITWTSGDLTFYSEFGAPGCFLSLGTFIVDPGDGNSLNFNLDYNICLDIGNNSPGADPGYFTWESGNLTINGAADTENFNDYYREMDLGGGPMTLESSGNLTINGCWIFVFVDQGPGASIDWISGNLTLNHSALTPDVSATGAYSLLTVPTDWTLTVSNDLTLTNGDNATQIINNGTIDWNSTDTSALANVTNDGTITFNSNPNLISLSGSSTATEGSTYTLDLGRAATGVSDTVEGYYVDWGDGLGFDYYDSPGNVTYTYSGSPTASTDYTISVHLATDTGLYLNAATKDIAVADIAPIIDFGDCPVGTVITDQYGCATFAADDPAFETRTWASANYYNQDPSLICTNAGVPIPGGIGHLQNPFSVTFTNAVDQLYFDVRYINNAAPAVIGEVDVYHGGQVSTVNIVSNLPSTGDAPGTLTMDLSAFQDVTRIHIYDLKDDWGLAFDNFSYAVGPWIVTPAATAADTGDDTTRSVSVLAGDDKGEANLTYAWSVTSAPDGAIAPTFTDNATNTAKNTTATFYQAGTYALEVKVTDQDNLSVTSDVNVTIDQDATTLDVSPSNIEMSVGDSFQFTATVEDQFGQSMSNSGLTWSNDDTSVGLVDQTGNYTASNVGTDTVRAQTSVQNTGDTGRHDLDGYAFVTVTEGDSAVHIGVDMNRDQTIHLTNGTDATSQDHPYQFWLNNNQDVDKGGPPEAQDDALGADTHASTSITPDNSDNAILNTRDLQDFSRFDIAYPTSLDWDQIYIYLVDANNTQPKIRIFSSVCSDDSYLFDQPTANDQVLADKNGGGYTVSDTDVFNVDKLHWDYNFRRNTPMTNTTSYADFLFEGVDPGEAQIEVTFKDANENILATSDVWIQLKDVSQMYETFDASNYADGGDGKGLSTAPGGFHDENPYPTPTTDGEKDYTLFVHGWNNDPQDRVNLANDVYKRLYWSGYQGRFGAFFWPCDWTDNPLTHPRNFDDSEFMAYQSGAPLRSVLTSLYGTYQTAGQSTVRVLSHSQGAVVVSEALRQEAVTRAPQKLVDVYVDSQGAVAADAYDPAIPYRTGVNGNISLTGNAGGDFGWDTPDWYKNYPLTGRGYYQDINLAANTIVDFYNPDDPILGMVWNADENVKPDLGYVYDPGSGRFGVGLYSEVSLFSWLPHLVPDLVTPIPLATGLATYQIFAYMDEAHSLSVGRIGIVGPFTPAAQVNLEKTFNFGNSFDWSHGAEFRGDMALRDGYWQLLLDRFGIPENRRWHFADPATPTR